jgi:DNA-directed RNA polymerase specialized sigma24 family protein
MKTVPNALTACRWDLSTLRIATSNSKLPMNIPDEPCYEDCSEQQLTELIQQFKRATSLPVPNSDEVNRIEQQIFELIAIYLRTALKPVLAKTFGKGVYSMREDSSVRFSVMLNDLFVKILDKERGAALRVETAKHLRNWCSRVIVNQMIDHIRKRKAQEQILQEVAYLYDMRRAAFSSRFGDTFDDFLELISDWYRNPNVRLREYAWLLELHYVMGMSWREVCEVMAMPKTTFFDTRKRAIDSVKRLLNPDALEPTMPLEEPLTDE